MDYIAEMGNFSKKISGILIESINTELKFDFHWLEFKEVTFSPSHFHFN